MDALTPCCDAPTLAAPIEEPKPPAPPPPPPPSPSPPPSPPPKKQESKPEQTQKTPPPPPKRADTQPQPAAVRPPPQEEAAAPPVADAKEAPKKAPAGGEQRFLFDVGSKSSIQVLHPFDFSAVGVVCILHALFCTSHPVFVAWHRSAHVPRGARIHSPCTSPRMRLVRAKASAPVQVVVTPGEVAMTTTLPTDGDLLLHWGLQVTPVLEPVVSQRCQPPQSQSHRLTTAFALGFCCWTGERPGGVGAAGGFRPPP